MTPTQLTTEAKETLRKTIRTLRPRLLDQLLEAAKGEYRLDVTPEKAKLPEARRCRRERLESWIAEQMRGTQKGKKGTDDLHLRFLLQAVKEAAHTWINRLVMLRILEHHGLLHPAVITGGWHSPAYEQEFVHYAGPLAQDDTRGYRDLLEVVFAELALELPGLYGPVGLVALFPMPAALLREVVEALNEPELASAWGDDMTLGWVYQYWNDPERERLDAKITAGGKIEPHEIASKTQMFTERYMVEWLLENSLGLTWLCICKRNGWTPDAETVLPVLDARRAEWRQQREAGTVALDALMPVNPGLESCWKYYVPQPIPDDAVSKAPSSIRDVKLLDPACGSGHFLVSAFGLFGTFYEEERRHRNETWSSEEIAESILANNLHGIDIDPRAIQIAAAALWLKAKLAAPNAKLGRMNLVAPVFRLASLPKEDPAVAQLYQELEALGVPPETTRKLVDSLSGVDHLGTLLRVDKAIAALAEDTGKQWGDLFARAAAKKQVALETCITQFLDAHATESDLGLRLEGEQLAAGLRFVKLVKEGFYDLVVGNPPYQGLSKTARFEYVQKNYPRGKADLYAAFLERALELLRDGGTSALVTMRGWMSLGQYTDLRHAVLHEFDIRGLADLGTGAFSSRSMDDVISTALVVVRRSLADEDAYAVQAAPLADPRRDAGKPARRNAALWCQERVFQFAPKAFKVIDGEPLLYWWSKKFLHRYDKAPKLGQVSPARVGLQTGDNTRFIRTLWELPHSAVGSHPSAEHRWAHLVKGAEGRSWIEPPTYSIQWQYSGMAIELHPGAVVRNRPFYFLQGVAYSTIGTSFTARSHWYSSVFGDMGSSVFPDDIAACVCVLNSARSRAILSSFNPSLHFTSGDVDRLSLEKVGGAETIWTTVQRAFSVHESHREASVEAKCPGNSPWRYAQDWAQLAVDRPGGDPLPPYEPEYDPPPPEAHVSFAIGVALGRFGANGEGILETAPESALPAGILFISPLDTMPDSLLHPASATILSAWDQQQAAINDGKKQPLRDWLRKDFFTYHKALYENRPIYFPLSSDKRSFVAYVRIHHWTDNTLQTLIADHLRPAIRQLDGEILDLNQARASSDKKTAAAAEKQYATVKRLHDELTDFIAAVTQCAERGAPPTDPKCPPRKADATFRMDLDDGVMINSAALWPLLGPQWKDPQKWWKELCAADGRKDYDWSHLARRYFPSRVEEKCKTDPSLAVAHGCFWKYHPAKAYAWELRLQDEIRADFLIEEVDVVAARERYLRENVAEAAATRDKEIVRRERKAAKAGVTDEADESAADDAGCDID